MSHPRGQAFHVREVPVQVMFTNHPGVDVAYRFNFPSASVVYLTDHDAIRRSERGDYFAGPG